MNVNGQKCRAAVFELQQWNAVEIKWFLCARRVFLCSADISSDELKTHTSVHGELR